MPPRKTTDFGALFESLIEDLRIQVAASVDLGDHLLLGRGEDQAGGRAKVSILSDAIEAVRSGFLDVLMFPVNMIGHDDEKAISLQRACEECGVGLVAMKPYHGGTLDKVTKPGRPAADKPPGYPENQQDQDRKPAPLMVLHGISAYLGGYEGGRQQDYQQPVKQPSGQVPDQNRHRSMSFIRHVICFLLHHLSSN